MCRLQPAQQQLLLGAKETDESGFSAELAVPDKKNKVGLKRGRVWAGNCTKHKRGCN